MDNLDRLRRRTKDEQTGLEVDENVLEEMLESAKNIIMSIRFPYGSWPDELENRYLDLQVRIAEDMFNRIGASGQKTHNENGVSRSWGSEWVSEQLLKEIVPYCEPVGFGDSNFGKTSSCKKRCSW